VLAFECTVPDPQRQADSHLDFILQLDVQIGALRLTDKIDWDLSSSLTPELFAIVLCRDLSLSSAAAPLIAHAVHEEILRIKRHLIQMGVVPLAEGTLAKVRGSSALEGSWRDWYETSSYGPQVQVLTLDEMDKRDEEREREIRYVEFRVSMMYDDMWSLSSLTQ
jgi:chromatin structure-remodeling complex subunit SFH1